ncbi:MAG: FAD:protein FMN transferase [Rickettsiales bacterium]|nr:FAD:protein FMN transferase [Rickettsiales bacterium]
MNKIRRCKPILGTFVEVRLKSDKSKDELLGISQKIFDEILRIEKMMSYFDKESEVFRLNKRAYFVPQRVSDELLEVLEYSLAISKLSNGVFDITIANSLVCNALLPDYDIKCDESATYRDVKIIDNMVKFDKRLAIDLGGIAKGYAIDKAISLFEECDVEIIINAGGDVRMSHWKGKKIDIRIPQIKDLSTTIEVDMQNCAIATSANYFTDEGKSKMVNLTDNEIVKRSFSISVFAKKCWISDALTKICFLSDDYQNMLKYFEASAFKLYKSGKIEYL